MHSFNWKSTEELSLMTLKSDAKFKKNWLVISNMTSEIWWVFTQILKSLKILLRWVLFVQSIKVWDKKIQRSYLLWHWTVIRNLNKPWPCGFKTGMKICNLMGSFCPKRNASGRKFQRNYMSWLKVDAKLKWKVTRGLKNDKEFG